jgi:hypothetical protein
MSKYTESLSNIQSSFTRILHSNLDSLQKDIRKKDKKLSWFLPVIKFVKHYTNYILVLLIGLSLYFSEQVINLFEIFLLFDSIILSLLILKNDTLRSHARRLAKNVISLFILYTNITGSLASIIIFFFVYLEFNKFINKIIFQLIDQIVNFLSATLPFMKEIYPNLRLIDHNKGFESTEKTIESSSESEDSESSDSDSYSTDSDTSNKSKSSKTSNTSTTKSSTKKLSSNTKTSENSDIKLSKFTDLKSISQSERKMYNKLISNIK